MQVKINNHEYQIDISADKYSGTINNEPFKLDIARRNESQFHLIKDHKSYCVDILHVDYEKKEIKLKVNGQLYEGQLQDDIDLLLKKMGFENKTKVAKNEIHAPMPGLVLNVLVEKGHKINKGDVILVLEAMKMENNLKAEFEGVVKQVHCKKGDTVNKSQLLITFE